MKGKLLTYDIVLIAIMTATMSLGKLVLMWLPQVEIVTLLIVVYAAVFKYGKTVMATLAFVVIEGVLYGIFQPWWWSYLIYWPFVATIASTVFRLINNELILAIGVAILTACFGVISSALESIILHVPFFAQYLFGMTFYITHIISNFVITLFAFTPIVKVLKQTVKIPSQDKIITDKPNK